MMRVKQFVSRHRGALGIVLAGAHAVLVIGVIASKDPLAQHPCSGFEDCFTSLTFVAERPFHISCESPLTKFLMIADSPAALIGGFLLLIPNLLLLSVSLEAVSYVQAFNWIVSGSIQWWFVGGLLSHNGSLLLSAFVEQACSFLRW